MVSWYEDRKCILNLTIEIETNVLKGYILVIYLSIEVVIEVVIHFFPITIRILDPKGVSLRVYSYAN